MKINYYNNDKQNSNVILEITKDGIFICANDNPHNLLPKNGIILTYNIGITKVTKQFTIKEVINKYKFTVNEKVADLQLKNKIANIYNIKNPENIININHNDFPIIMLFSSNIYDIRGLQFFSIVNKDRFINNNKKLLNEIELNFICKQ